MSKLRHLLVYITLTIASSSHANLENFNYYPTSLISKLSTLGKEGLLKEKLRDVLASYHEQKKGRRDIIHSVCPAKANCIRQRRDISYKEARTFLFGKLHLKKDSTGYFIEDRYCQNRYGQEHGVGPKRIPNHRFINCEHTWPQSRFNPNYSKSAQKNDIHHLFPVNSSANSARGKIIFGEVNGGPLSSKCQSSRRGTIDYGNLEDKAFEPPKEHRGDLARALFYFSVRYNSPISEEEEYYLRRWHKEDPVSEFERKRNQEIYNIQNNRNPFIDQANLVDEISDF